MLQNLHAILKTFSIRCIRAYQRFISPLFGPRCVFYPSCSEYSKEAIEKYGIFRGIYLGFQRILRCHPWQTEHIDPVP